MKVDFPAPLAPVIIKRTISIWTYPFTKPINGFVVMSYAQVRFITLLPVTGVCQGLFDPNNVLVTVNRNVQPDLTSLYLAV